MLLFANTKALLKLAVAFTLWWIAFQRTVRGGNAFFLFFIIANDNFTFNWLMAMVWLYLVKWESLTGSHTYQSLHVALKCQCFYCPHVKGVKK